MADERNWDLEREPDPATPGPGTTRLIGDLSPLPDLAMDARSGREVKAGAIDLDELRPDELELLHELQQPSGATPDPDLLVDLAAETLDPPALDRWSGTGEDAGAAEPREALRLGTPSSEPDPLNPVFQEPRPLR